MLLFNTFSYTIFYLHQNEKCRFNAANIGANMTSYKDIASKNETALQVAVATVGPISVGIDASHISFKVGERSVSLYLCAIPQSMSVFFNF